MLGIGLLSLFSVFQVLHLDWGQEFFLQATSIYLQAAGVPAFQNLQGLQLFEFPLIGFAP